MSTGYRIQIPPTTQLHRIEIEKRIKQLRDLFGEHEQWFKTRSQVLVYLNEVVGARTEYNQRITIHALRRWRRFARFPYFAPKPKIFYTSNLMIMAWLWEFRLYQATKPNKPRTWDLTNASRSEPGI